MLQSTKPYACCKAMASNKSKIVWEGKQGKHALNIIMHI